MKRYAVQITQRATKDNAIFSGEVWTLINTKDDCLFENSKYKKTNDKTFLKNLNRYGYLTRWQAEDYLQEYKNRLNKETGFRLDLWTYDLQVVEYNI